MSMHVTDGTIHAFLDGELEAVAGAGADDVRRHLERCAACRRRLAEEAALREAASTILGDAAPAAGPLPALEELRARARATAPRTGSIGPLGRNRRWAWAASVVLALGLGWAVRDRTPVPPGVGAERTSETAGAGSAGRSAAEAPSAPDPGSHPVPMGAPSLVASGAGEGAGAAGPRTSADEPGADARREPVASERGAAAALADAASPEVGSAEAGESDAAAPSGAASQERLAVREAPPVDRVPTGALASSGRLREEAAPDRPVPTEVVLTGAARPGREGALARERAPEAGAADSLSRARLPTLDAADGRIGARLRLAPERPPSAAPALAPRSRPASTEARRVREPPPAEVGVSEPDALVLTVEALDLLSVEWSEVARGVRAVRVLQRIEPSDTLELVVIAGGPDDEGAEAALNAVLEAPLRRGWSRLVRVREGARIVALAPLPAAELSRLVEDVGRR